MRRRDFIAGPGYAAVWPVLARAQQGDRMRRRRGKGTATWAFASWEVDTLLGAKRVRARSAAQPMMPYMSLIVAVRSVSGPVPPP
jgi:hypothetical protein